MHRHPSASIVLALLLFTCAAASSAEIYRWTDASGREHFSANPLDVPESQRARASATDGVGGGTLSSFGSPDTPRRSRSRNAALVKGRSGLPAASDAASAREPRIGGRTEISWRESAQSYADELAQAEQSLEACEARDAEKRMSSGLTALDACAAKESAVESAEESLAGFEEMARSKGVPPGWLR